MKWKWLQRATPRPSLAGRNDGRLLDRAMRLGKCGPGPPISKSFQCWPQANRKGWSLSPILNSVLTWRLLSDLTYEERIEAIPSEEGDGEFVDRVG